MPQGRASQQTALIVIEEPTVRELMAFNLRQAGMFAMTAASLVDGHRLAREVRPDIIFLDLDAVGADDAEFVADFTRMGSSHQVTTVMMSSRMSAVCGANDMACGASLCVQKPFSPRELLDRLHQHLRARPILQSRPPENKLRYGVLELDLDCLRASLHSDAGPRSIDLAVTEVKLLHYLMSHAYRANRREDILADVWGNKASIDLRTIDQHIRRLRRNLGRIGAAGLIRTVYGYGYRIDEAIPPITPDPAVDTQTS